MADDESLEVGFFAVTDLPADLSPQHRKRIADSMAKGPATFEMSPGPVTAGAGGMSPFVRGLRAKVGTDRVPLIGVSAVVMDDTGRLLLVRSSEIDQWMPVGGMVEPGEQPAMSAAREVLEEAGAVVAVEHLVGIYDGPDVVHGNGDQVTYTTFAFRCRMTGGDLKPDGTETTDVRFFGADRLPPMRADHQRNIKHALARRTDTFFVLNRP